MLSYIFDTSNWRAEDDNISVNYFDDKSEGSFSNIDPISRNVSVKSNVFPSTSVIAQRIFKYPPHVPPSTIHEETGSHISGDETLNGSKLKKNSSFSIISELKKTTLEPIPSYVNDNIEEEDNISEDSNRIPGRLSDWLKKNEHQTKPGLILFPKVSNQVSKNSCDIISDKIENTGILFGPPPTRSSVPSSSIISQSTWKSLQNDNTKNKCFEKNQSFISETPSDNEPSTSSKKKLSKQNKVNEESINVFNESSETNQQREKNKLQDIIYEKNITNVNIDDNSEFAKSLLLKKEENPLKTKHTIKLKRPKPIETPVQLL